MSFRQCDVKTSDENPFELWDDKWLLLTSGNFSTGHFNCMTVAWGSFGIMWKKPFAQIVVRPTRHTFEFINDYPDFTLCAFPPKYRKALQLLGTKSGRDGDKIAEAGLTAIASQQVASPAFAQAELIYECKKIYWQDMKAENFQEERIEKLYPKKDYHRIYFGEILGLYEAVK